MHFNIDLLFQATSAVPLDHVTVICDPAVLKNKMKVLLPKSFHLKNIINVIKFNIMDGLVMSVQNYFHFSICKKF